MLGQIQQWTINGFGRKPGNWIYYGLLRYVNPPSGSTAVQVHGRIKWADPNEAKDDQVSRISSATPSLRNNAHWSLPEAICIYVSASCSYWMGVLFVMIHAGCVPIHLGSDANQSSFSRSLDTSSLLAIFGEFRIGPGNVVEEIEAISGPAWAHGRGAGSTPWCRTRQDHGESTCKTVTARTSFAGLV